MNWDPLKIRYLRRRMGWSPSDLARRLNCESRLIIDWELGKNFPIEDHLQILEMLSLQAESEAEQITSCPLAEIIMDETRESQISHETIKKRFSQNN